MPAGESYSKTHQYVSYSLGEARNDAYRMWGLGVRRARGDLLGLSESRYLILRWVHRGAILVLVLDICSRFEYPTA